MFRTVLKAECAIVLGLFAFVFFSDWRTLTHTFTERIRLYKIRKERGE